jgi:ABC-type ATPase involved in cell division
MQYLSVKNFGPIKDATIEVNALTVLIGEHASGKSTLAKLVYFFKSLKKDLVELSRLDPNEINATKVKNTLRDKFYFYFGSTRLLPESYLVKFCFAGGKCIVLEGSPLRLQFESTNWSFDLAKHILDIAPAVNFYRMRNEFEAALKEEKKLEQRLGEFLGDHSDAFFIPAGRNITTSYPESFLEAFYQQLPQLTAPKVDDEGNVTRNDAQKINLYLIREFIGKTSLWKEYFKGTSFARFLAQVHDRKHLIAEIDQLLKGSYKVNDSIGEHLVLKDGQRVLLENSSSGQQESIRIIQDVVLSITDGQPVFRVIEEPEAHLFPSGQESILKLLAALINSSGSPAPEKLNTVFITTHSPYILNIINNMVFAGLLNPNPQDRDEISKIGLPPIFRLYEGQVSAYMMNENGECIQINQSGSDTDVPEGEMIGDNILEKFRDSLQDQFDHLMEVEPQG